MRSSSITLLCAVFGTTSTLLSQAAASSPNLVADPATGVTYHGNLSSGVESFLNIRYAEETSGKNRFAPPIPFQYPRHTVVNATQNGAACPQAPSTGLLAIGTTDFSEDCLTLRVDRLEKTTSSSNLPVMIWIYGGGFTSGWAYESQYDPVGLLKIAEANGSPVIYAALNYRVSVWGFAMLETLAANHSLNVGLSDQRMALEWIKSNIQKFGGNPNNITVFGQSAGAISIGHQIAAYGGTEPVPFHRAIMESGMSTSCPGTVSDICTNHTAALANLLNCTRSDSYTELECLRAVPLDTMIPVVDKYQLSVNRNSFFVWQPVAPSKFIPDAPSKLLASGRFAKNIDTINGWTENDGSIFPAPDITTDAEVIYTVTNPAILNPSTTDKLLALYPLSDYRAAESGNHTATAQFFRTAEMWRDSQFLCPAFALDQARINLSLPKRPTSYLYYMNTTLDTPILQATNETYLGVAHGSEISFVFDTVPADARATTSQKQLGGYLSASWAAFANSGNVSYGTLTLPDWKEAYTGADKMLSIRIVGGPNDGTASLNANVKGALASEDLAKRCAFWNSQIVRDQLQA